MPQRTFGQLGEWAVCRRDADDAHRSLAFLVDDLRQGSRGAGVHVIKVQGFPQDGSALAETQITVTE